jgi:hypothetical protein
VDQKFKGIGDKFVPISAFEHKCDALDKRIDESKDT